MLFFFNVEFLRAAYRNLCRWFHKTEKTNKHSLLPDRGMALGIPLKQIWKDGKRRCQYIVIENKDAYNFTEYMLVP